MPHHNNRGKREGYDELSPKHLQEWLQYEEKNGCKVEEVEERSAGCIVFSRDAKRDVFILLIKNHKGVFGFPKGHLEDGEDDLTAAIRETFEETGVSLSPSSLINDHKAKFEVRKTLFSKMHKSAWQKHPNFPNELDRPFFIKYKTIVYFPMISESMICKPQLEEISEAYFVSIQEALTLLDPKLSRILSECIQKLPPHFTAHSLLSDIDTTTHTTSNTNILLTPETDIPTTFGLKEKDYSLVFCRRVASDGSKEILLGKKKRGFGEGKWIGYGGKLEANDFSMRHCACRELEEESTLQATRLTYRGLLIFIMLDSQMVLNVHVYDTYDFIGQAIETEEMIPQWYKENDIPYEQSWHDTKIWLPVVLDTTDTFEGRFLYQDDDTILQHVMKTMSS